MNMDPKIGSELLKQIEKAKKEDPHRDIPVILTTRSDADPQLLEQKGLKIRNIFESISAISGTVDINDVNELSQLDQVIKIEYDGEVHTL